MQSRIGFTTLAVGDVDRDGVPELVTSNVRGAIGVFRFDGRRFTTVCEPQVFPGHPPGASAVLQFCIAKYEPKKKTYTITRIPGVVSSAYGTIGDLVINKNTTKQ